MNPLISRMTEEDRHSELYSYLPSAYTSFSGSQALELISLEERDKESILKKIREIAPPEAIKFEVGYDDGLFDETVFFIRYWAAQTSPSVTPRSDSEDFQEDAHPRRYAGPPIQFNS